jgi:hypothetical protein
MTVSLCKLAYDDQASSPDATRPAHTWDEGGFFP